MKIEDFAHGWEKSPFKINKYGFHGVKNATVYAAKLDGYWTAHLWEHGTAKNNLFFGSGKTRKESAAFAYNNWKASKPK